MKPQSADYLAKARECLAAAKTINAIPLPPVAAKEAYLTAYGVGLQSVVTVNEAQDVIAIAQRFIDTVTQLLPPGVTPPHGPSA